MKLLYLLLCLLLVSPLAFSGVNFNGDADSINSTSNAGVTTHPCSVSFWVYLSSASLQGCFFNIGDYFVGGHDGWGVGVGSWTFEKPTNIGNELIVLANGIRWIRSGDTIGTGWHHIAVTVNASGHFEQWIDGNQVYTEGSGTAPRTTYNSQINIGGYYDGITAGGPYDRYVNASITELYIWDSVISDNEISLLASSRKKLIGLQISPSNLKEYVPFDSYSDGTSMNTDSSGYQGIYHGYTFTGTDADNDSTNIAEEVLTY